MRCSFPGTNDVPVREIRSDKAPAPTSILWDKGEQMGNYTIIADEHVRHIFPFSNRLGHSVRVTLIQRFIHVRHDRSGATFTFSHYNHQRRWIWRDSRDKNSVAREHVLGEVARLLCSGDKAKAAGLVNRYLG